jgi:crotonobetainyl-CoA:carnitine CoA-transferase CaiB-like acyl-CoA transferase
VSEALVGKGALNGVRVLEASVHLNGPIAGRMLGELGAEVIKVEPPGGEPNRKNEPRIDGESILFMNYNCNKKFITLNLKHPRGREVFLELAKKCDVVLENFRPGVMDRLGVGYEDLKKVNPSIIYASSSGYGISGPYRDEAAYDTLIQAMTGIMDLTGPEDSPPIRSAPAFIDMAGGTSCALAIIAALYHKEKTGEGQRIDIAMYDVAINNVIGLYSFMQGGTLAKTGNWVPVLAPYNVYKASDGYIVIIIGEDSRWKAFLEAIGRDDLATDTRFESINSRLAHHEEIDDLISTWVKDMRVADAVELVKKAGGAAGPVRSINALTDDPQVKAREMIVEVQHPTFGAFRTLGSAFKMSQTPGEVRSPGLPLGYNNEEVYGKMLGFDRGKLESLKADGAI